MLGSTSQGVAHSRYEALQSDRENVLRRGRQAAALTVPHLLVPNGHTQSSELPTPFQSIGARGVRNLSSKLLLTLFPPNQPNFKYDLDDFAVMEIEARAGIEGRGEIEKALSARERAVTKEYEKASFRPTGFEVFRQLLVTGNCLLNVPKQGMAKSFKLDQYVVKRDWSGNLLECILKQTFSALSLPEPAQLLLSSDVKQMISAKGSAPVDVYTYIKREKNGKYSQFEELCGNVIPGSDAMWKEEDMPWLALRLTKIDGEDYGRGYVEEYIGDLMSLEGLSQAMVEGSAACARVVTVVSPNGVTSMKDIAEAENGAVIAGRPDDVAMLQAEKRADFSVVSNQISAIEQRLAFAFLMNTAIQRNGERVTAEEIRYMAQELEDALGGMYSLLAQEMQLPLVKLFESRMEKRRKVPKLPKDMASPTIITGIDALGRGQDLKNLDAFLIGLGETFGPEVIGRYVKLGEAIKRRGAALGIDMNGLIKSDEEIAQEEQQAQMMAMAQNLGPQAMQVMGQLGGKQMDNETKQAIADQKQSPAQPQGQ